MIPDEKDKQIKLTVEISDGLFKWSYAIGGSHHFSEAPLTADSLVSFTEILKYCRTADFKGICKYRANQ